ncbi:hypothetical protein J437_LFUL000284 [Ladona fulva]|uniref:Uncharacterized protein n=1 Tax=Ladona fulva TaxID=123851 RepID=A0A8K0K3L9_LADFU|nr:hypothetical protein J437_LFUL000284 [Ladona fulva]
MKRQLLFPTPSSKVQWVIAIGIPATVDNKKLGFGLSLKLNYYTLPLNASDVVYPYIDIKNKRESGDANAQENSTPTDHPGLLQKEKIVETVFSEPYVKRLPAHFILSITVDLQESFCTLFLP